VSGWPERGAEAFRRIAADEESYGEMLDDLPEAELSRILESARLLSSVTYDRIEARRKVRPLLRPVPNPPDMKVVTDTKQARRTSSTKGKSQ